MRADGPSAASQDLVHYDLRDSWRSRYPGRTDAGGDVEPVGDRRWAEDEIASGADRPKAHQLAHRQRVNEGRDHRLARRLDPQALGRIARAIVLVDHIDCRRAEEQAAEDDRCD